MSSSNGTEYGYRIQARSITDIPTVLQDGPLPLVLTKDRWTTIPTAKNALTGVPNRMWNRIADEQGMLAYTTALALMAKLAAELQGGDYIEFRLLKQKLTYSWEISDESTSEPFSFCDKHQDEKFTPITTPTERRDGADA